ncbi:MAG TPA: 5-oxoprolinase subunit PxpB [Candidatus Eisenbacteria bacterium]|nr:5-oxoprolinase subunit PxpB [Candidatus Eisenbacteria bacterium]
MRFQAASDQSLLVYLGDEIGAAAHGRVVRMLRALQREPVAWIRNVQPAYCSLLVTFDAAVVGHAEVQAKLSEYEKLAEKLSAVKPGLVEVPVCYGGEFGPDLDDVAAKCNLSPAKVVALHCTRTYHAYFLGFAPGFAYLGELAPEIATPRLETPRKEVVPGSVGVAGTQTAVYPFATPGGWRLIGRTPLAIFQKDREPMGLISIGDEVRFRPISREEFSWRSRA